MKQPRLTPKGHLRRMQMSRHKVFVFIEGKESDGYLLGELCKRAFKNKTYSYTINQAAVLTNGEGGKNVLIYYYKYLLSHKYLDSTLNGKKTQIIFFLDKDIDDLLNKKCKSDHVLYTKYYDVQNHLFKQGDFIQALASTCSIPESIVRTHSDFGNGWCSNAAERWREWVTLCVFCKKNNIEYPNFGTLSQVNVPLNGGVDRARYYQLIHELYKRSNLSLSVFFRKLRTAKKTVDRLYLKNDSDRVFKGKWYSHILDQDLKKDSQFQSAHIKGAGDRIKSCLALTMDFSNIWAVDYISTLQKIGDR